MKKRPRVAILNTVEDTRVNLIEDANEWGIVKTSAGKELLLGMYRIGKLARVESFNPVAEAKQIVVLGADATPEVIVASTRYKVEIGNPDDKYESQKRGPAIHAYTSAATLSGNADTDRSNVYSALVTKINAYAGNNVAAYLLTVHDYTGGTSTGDTFANFIVGEEVEQATSTETARVAKCTITSGTFAGDDAAGKIYVFDISTPASWLDTAVTLSAGAGTGESNCVVTQTNATQVDNGGICIEDDAGYFISNIARAGTNWVGATQGWLTTVAELGLAGVYSMGIGSTMAQLIPRYDHGKVAVISGFLEYELQAGDTFDVAKTYRKYVFTFLEGDEDAIGGTSEKAESQSTLYVDAAATHIGDLDTAIGNLT